MPEVVVLGAGMPTLGEVLKRTAAEFRSLVNQFPDGVATRRQLIRAGLDQGDAARLARYGTPWRRLLPGVYLLHSGEPTRRQLVRAAVLHASPEMAITGLEAVRRYGVRRIPDDPLVHVLVPARVRIAGTGFLLIERTKRPWEEHTVDGLPLAAPARALVDHARRESRVDVVRSMFADAVQRRICDVADLTAELTDLRLTGTALPRGVIAEVGDGVRSAAEAWARSLVRRSSLPDPRWNVELATSSGRFLGIVDAWWDDVGLAWEIDSREFHSSPDDYEHTMARHSAFASAGVLVVHTAPSQLKQDPLGVIRDLAGAYEYSARRPRPEVTANLRRPAA